MDYFWGIYLFRSYLQEERSNHEGAMFQLWCEHLPFGGLKCQCSPGSKAYEAVRTVPMVGFPDELKMAINNESTIYMAESVIDIATEGNFGTPISRWAIRQSPPGRLFDLVRPYLRENALSAYTKGQSGMEFHRAAAAALHLAVLETLKQGAHRA